MSQVSVGCQDSGAAKVRAGVPPGGCERLSAAFKTVWIRATGCRDQAVMTMASHSSPLRRRWLASPQASRSNPVRSCESDGRGIVRQTLIRSCVRHVLGSGDHLLDQGLCRCRVRATRRRHSCPVLSPRARAGHDDRPDDGLADDGDEGTLVVGIDVVVEMPRWRRRSTGGSVPIQMPVDDPHAQVDGRVGVAGKCAANRYAVVRRHG